jgi:hypothetical protein
MNSRLTVTKNREEHEGELLDFRNWIYYVVIIFFVSFTYEINNMVLVSEERAVIVTCS